MRKDVALAIGALLLLGLIFLFCSKGNSDESENVPSHHRKQTTHVDMNKAIPMTQVTLNGHTYDVADIQDSVQIYGETTNKKSCLYVISKREYRLYVYDCGKDTTLLASFPICYAKDASKKEKEGDNRTPECTLDSTYSIQSIENASSWIHDFDDGRGEIAAYGKWFIRLKCGYKSIGIHGSTNNEASIPGRDSEGCIRLRDADLITFHDKYAQVGQKVVIKGVNEKKLPFEVRAEKALGKKYIMPKPGYQKPAENPTPSIKQEGRPTKDK